MKLTSRHIAAFFLLILLSVGFGFAFDGIATAIEKGRHSRSGGAGGRPCRKRL